MKIHVVTLRYNISILSPFSYGGAMSPYRVYMPEGVRRYRILIYNHVFTHSSLLGAKWRLG